MTFSSIDMQVSKTTVKIDKNIRQSLKHAARKDQTYSQLVEERIKCDAAGCEEAGTNEIKVNAGKFGKVTLFVCSRCLGIFQD
jgi:hypothetical protein